MLEDFHFKIVHHLGNKHFNVDVLNKNLVFVSDEMRTFKLKYLIKWCLPQRMPQRMGFNL